MPEIADPQRSIPAPAGEPVWTLAGSLLPPVYPRACGGTHWQQGDYPTEMGLSPRLRGNQPTPVALKMPIRSIPAPAGEPRTWSGLSGSARRSIPAPAGEPLLYRDNRMVIRVYPRACGGTMAPPTPPTKTSGLSPRLRGNLRGRPCWRPDPAVYPRACGGTLLVGSANAPTAGLSPRLRGNRESSFPGSLSAGSIPAPAGEPLESVYRDRRPWVYPRACGGTWFLLQMPLSMTGLSPRLRGNPQKQVVMSHTS